MTREEQLEELLVRWEEATAAGPTPTLADFCRGCPDLLADFRALLARLAPVNGVLGDDDCPAAAPEELMATLAGGRYRPVSYHRGGGLGLVFVAEDTELRRTVALKCLQPAAAVDADA